MRGADADSRCFVKTYDELTSTIALSRKVEDRLVYDNGSCGVRCCGGCGQENVQAKAVLENLTYALAKL